MGILPKLAAGCSIERTGNRLILASDTTISPVFHDSHHYFCLLTGVAPLRMAERAYALHRCDIFIQAGGMKGHSAALEWGLRQGQPRDREKVFLLFMGRQ